MALQELDTEKANEWITQEIDEWITPEIRKLLAKIRGQHAAKKRRTVLLLAFARAYGQSMESVFGREDTCNQRVWWQKWQYLSSIQAALEACTAQALEWVDQETVVLEAEARKTLRQSVAGHAPKAPEALANVMEDPGQAGGTRIKAAETLRDWLLAPEQARSGQGASLSVRVTEIDAEIERELARLAGGGETGDVGAVEDEADANEL